MSKVTVILPVYNNKNDVQKAIMSIINQTYKNWELLIINDASTDGTENILKKYSDNSNIKIINNKKNMGCYWSLNHGISISDSPYITRIDSDDIYHRDKLKKQVQFLDNNQNYIGMFTKCRIGNSTMPKCMATLMMRRYIVDKIGYYDSVRFAADLEYKRRMFLYFGEDKFKLSNEIMYFIKVRPISLSKNRKTGMHTIPRELYNKNFIAWHKENTNSKEKLYMPFPLLNRPFKIHQLSQV
jgi:glycosyltransferase involved in cell wall biosynthesis